LYLDRVFRIVSLSAEVYSGDVETAAKSGNRPYDIVVVGASGFTGKLVVEYLAERYPVGGPIRWAVAGRNREKLEGVIAEQCATGERPTVLVADSHDGEALGKLARDARVVLTTVGPYAKYGSELVAACVESGTHYCDLAGESQWIREMIDKHQAAAVRSGAKIVNSCGFDSIPSDIGVHFLQREAQGACGEPCEEIVLLVKAIKGGASGGTFASMLNAVEEARKDSKIARVMADPYCLNPQHERQGPDGADQQGVRFCADAEVWTAPFVMAAINTRVVRRTNALLDYAYGREFRYSEATSTGRGFGGWCKAATMTAGLAAFMLACSFELSRRGLVRKMLPAPGQGPSRQQRENGFFDLRLFGKLKSGETLQARVTGDRDPGYGSTSKMLSESAACLAMDDPDIGGGFWTPAAAMGEILMDRLTANAGLRFELMP
jgi:short subunit dehydrogenase-like uncharacterized protein